MFHYPLRRILQHLCPHSAPHHLVQFHLRVRYHHHKLMIIRMIHLDKMEVLLLQLIEIQLKKFLVKIMLKSKIPLYYIVITNGDLQKHHFHQHSVYWKRLEQKLHHKYIMDGLGNMVDLTKGFLHIQK
jgi:hypothetical protein